MAEKKSGGEAAVLDKIPLMQEYFRAMGERVQALVEYAWYFTALDDATEARLSAIVGRIANEGRAR